jgi:hypothetical protein
MMIVSWFPLCQEEKGFRFVCASSYGKKISVHLYHFVYVQ